MSRSPAPARAALLLAALLAAQFVAAAPVADSDADGQSRALSDGLLALRFQLGFRAAALADGAVPEGATRTVHPQPSPITSRCTTRCSTSTATA